VSGCSWRECNTDHSLIDKAKSGVCVCVVGISSSEKLNFLSYEEMGG